MKTNGLVIAIGNDHTAYEFKQPIIKFLHTEGYQILDLGTNSSEPVDYPNFGFNVSSVKSRFWYCNLWYWYWY